MNNISWRDDKYLYVASPKIMYDTPFYDKALNYIRSVYPDYGIHPAKGMFIDSRVWQNNWLIISTQIDVLIFFADDNNVIGLGTYTEIRTVLPSCDIYYLTHSLKLIPMNKIELSIIDNGHDWANFAEVIVTP